MHVTGVVIPGVGTGTEAVPGTVSGGGPSVGVVTLAGVVFVGSSAVVLKGTGVVCVIDGGGIGIVQEISVVTVGGDVGFVIDGGGVVVVVLGD